MNAPPRLLLVFLAGGLLGPGLRAELTWERTEAAIDVKSWSPKSTVHFAFKNAGAAPVKITKIAAGCGCTDARASSETIAPGASGEITADFHPVGKSGGVRIPILVNTDDGAETTLILAALIQEGLRFDSRFLYWKEGEPRDTRTLRFSVVEPGQVQLGELSSTQPGFTAQLRAVANATPGTYEIVVTPPATGGPAFSAVVLKTKEGPGHADQMYTLLARTF